MNKVFLNWYKKLGENYIKEIINDFDLIEKEFYEDRNKENVLNVYFEYEKVIRDKHLEIKKLNEDVNVLKRHKYDIKNYVINKLRNENKLVDFLKNKDRLILGRLKNVVDINNEYNIVDRIKFEEEKKIRGNNIKMSLNN